MNKLQKIKKLKRDIEYQKSLLHSDVCFSVIANIHKRIKELQAQLKSLEG